ncbi:MAG: hypothetical protein ACI9TH_001246 [Kiritimatiellia bacterium]|jgi:uncharacterized protein (TIGR00251 family)
MPTPSTVGHQSNLMKYLESHEAGMLLRLRVIPRAKKNQVDGLLGEALKIRLQSPPVDGKANKALLKFLSDQLGVPGANLRLISGEKSRDKRVLIQGLSATQISERLELTT